MPGQIAVRISIDDGDGALVSNIRATLEAAGFDVLGSSDRGVDASAPQEVMERFFGTTVTGDASPRFSGQPKLDRLPKNAAYRVYFPRRPEHF